MNATMNQVGHLLQEPDDQAFLGKAYIAILGRPIDPDGHRNYMGRLRAGEARGTIVQELSASDEAQARRPRPAHAAGPARAPRAVDEAAGGIDDLLNCPDEAFIRLAYAAVLGRAPDPAGLLLYERVLETGVSRMHVLAELSQSVEAAERGRSVRGLAAAVARYRKANRRDWTGWFMRQVKGVESEMPIERQMRAISFRLRTRGRSDEVVAPR